MKEKQEKVAQPKKKLSLDGDYPGLNGLTYCIGYMEQLLASLSEPLLVGCSTLAVVDFITGGGLLAIPILSYLWAAGIAVSVSACFIVTWRRALRAITQNHYGVFFGLAALGLLLGIVDWTAVATQSLQQSMSMGYADALKSLGMNVFWITNVRAAVTIAMSVVVAVSNHSAVTTAQAPKRRVALFDRVIDRFAPVVSDEIEHHEDTVDKNEQETRQKVREHRHDDRLKVVNMNGDTGPLERVKRALTQNPNCSDRELGRLAKMAPLTAKKYRTMLANQEGEQTA